MPHNIASDGEGRRARKRGKVEFHFITRLNILIWPTKPGGVFSQEAHAGKTSLVPVCASQ